MARQELGATMLALADTGLLRLVDELLLNVLDYVTSIKDLRNLAATCTRLQGLAEPYIWRSLVVHSGTHARDIATALDKRDERVDFIQNLSIQYKDPDKEGIEDLNHWLTLMSKLRHLTLESPCPNNSEWRPGDIFDGWSRINYSNLMASSVFHREGIPMALPMLQSLTLHAHGPEDRKFELDDRLASVFYHPTLHNLSISCLNISNRNMESTIESFGKKRKSTPLRSLTFIECNIDMDTLYTILSLPKALKELSIGERLYVFETAPPSTDATQRTSSKRFLPALQQQADSLEKLTHIGGSLPALPARETDEDGAVKLRSMSALQHLELGFESHLYYYLRNNGFPPRLRYLKMLDSAIANNYTQQPDALTRTVFRSTTSLVTQCFPSSVPDDFTLHLHYAHNLFFRLEEAEEWISRLFLSRPLIYKIADVLHEHKGRFVVSRDHFSPGKSYIPPFMYEEELPIEKVLYNSDDYFTFNGKDYRIMDDDRFKAKVERDLLICPKCTGRGFTEREWTSKKSCPAMDTPEVDVLLIGDAGCGKSTFLSRLSLGVQPQSDDLPPYALPTLRDSDQPFEFDISLYGRPYKLRFYDTKSPQNYTLLRPHFVIMCYDISSRASLESLSANWLPVVNGHYNYDENLPVMVLGLKRDLRKQWKPEEIGNNNQGLGDSSIMPHEGLQATQRMLCDMYAECSALTGELCREVLQDVAKTCAKTTTGEGAKGGGPMSECAVM
ncbi:hypothetical protein E8E13_006577 [Curvularia kusanoi]|uniref:F-box domain-containing protein n=1 Tax=Curvularia kusanoi TaxID=90978 RepID=A0A9P4T9B9_CURKU|nr:hypothetical protein E8E13_006577 [Curvularia kusanoi]